MTYSLEWFDDQVRKAEAGESLTCDCGATEDVRICQVWSKHDVFETGVTLLCPSCRGRLLGKWRYPDNGEYEGKLARRNKESAADG